MSSSPVVPNERIAELERHMRAWMRRSRRRTLLLVLVPLAVAGGLAYVGQARLDRIERALDRHLAGLSGDPREQALPLGLALDRVGGLAAEVRGLRPLPAQLAAEREARARAEQELGAARGQVATLTAERDGLAAALGTAKGELSRAQAERADLEQRVAELARVRQALDEARAGLDAANQRVAELERVLAEAVAGWDDLSRELEAARAAEAEARQARTELERRLRELEEALAEARRGAAA